MGSPHSRISFHRYSSAVRPPRMAVSCSLAKGTRTPPHSRGISMKRGLVRAAISRASVTRALINNGNNGPTVAHFGEQIRFVNEKPRRG